MNQPAKAQEPSMEEILASIRRIIADDEPAAKPAPAPKPAAAAPVPAAPEPPPLRMASSPFASKQAELEAALANFGQPHGQEPVDAAEPDVFELTESMAAPTPRAEPPASFRTIDAQPDVMFTEAPAPAIEDQAPTASEPHPAQPQDRPLLSGSTMTAVDSAFNTLAQTVLVHNARTLEDLVREMLRPMLKNWLDDNLPGLVERLVRAEIERVSRGRSG
ncbi:MAG: PopZ family protein [Pseudorhodoplanes sp.]